MEKREIQEGTETVGQVNCNYPIGKASGIAVYENVFSQSFLDNLLFALSEDFQTLFAPGPTLGGVDPFIKLCSDTNFMHPDAYQPSMRNFDLYLESHRHIRHQIWSCIVHYVQEYRHLQGAPNMDITGSRIQRYSRNAGYYREHCDGHPWIPATARHPHRILAVVAYLNTVTDGGGTIFPSHDYTSEAIAGRVVVFPTTWLYPHIGAVPLSGDKWIISSFVTTRWDETYSYPFELNPPNPDDEGFVYPTEKKTDNSE